ncbi:site-specific recombinase xerd [Salinarchaeum sp. Harcht-Bsk1]|uniref:tyrosine-type recombinase/integrase n=1 Tax=Salinarchaeum sp. Harcht-Bsk1 TaxID=1333523 RepID=UPI0003424413|nr:tyrosine-type recombinase/integrase [Salinarchaeum sp. Harcht-Bsk1]AGN01144.1 site-specific recombinase xerd [Salinarchaeum sp. Harcht-Bsk1]
MNDAEFNRVIKRVKNSKTEATANQYVPKIREFRTWLTEGEKDDEGNVLREQKPFEEADVIDVEDWLGEQDEKYSNASSVGKADAALVAAFDELNKLITSGRIDGEPWPRDTPADRADYTPNDTSTIKSRELKQDLHYLKPDEVDQMVEETDKLRDGLIIRLLFQTGLRVSELTDIRLSDLDEESRSIAVRGKGRKNRTVFYQPSLALPMHIWLTDRRPAVFYAEESEYLFPTSHSECITRAAVTEMVREVAEQAGIQEVYGTTTDGVERHSVTPHVLRHSFAMAALDNGWDVYTLSQALGHASTEITTSTYLHDDEEQVREAYQLRGPSN